jgi:PRD1 phage membrane DNA delivery
MSDQFLTSLVTVATAIIGVAILAVLVSSKSNTTGVISAAGGAFAKDLSAAISPLGGGGNSFTNLTGGGAGSVSFN